MYSTEEEVNISIHYKSQQYTFKGGNIADERKLKHMTSKCSNWLYLGSYMMGIPLLERGTYYKELLGQVTKLGYEKIDCIVSL